MKKTIKELSKDQIKELCKSLRSNKVDILINAIKQVNLDFISDEKNIPVLLNNIRVNNVFFLINLIYFY